MGERCKLLSGVWGEAPSETLLGAYLSLKSCFSAIVSPKYLIVEFVVMTKFGHILLHHY